MWLARIVCSDPECTEEQEVVIAEMGELNGYVCQCGYGFVLIQVAELASP